jgi:hypothetical protein
VHLIQPNSLAQRGEGFKGELIGRVGEAPLIKTLNKSGIEYLTVAVVLRQPGYSKTKQVWEMIETDNYEVLAFGSRAQDIQNNFKLNDPIKVTGTLFRSGQSTDANTKEIFTLVAADISAATQEQTRRSSFYGQLQANVVDPIVPKVEQNGLTRTTVTLSASPTRYSVKDQVWARMEQNWTLELEGDKGMKLAERAKPGEPITIKGHLVSAGSRPTVKCISSTPKLNKRELARRNTAAKRAPKAEVVVDFTPMSLELDLDQQLQDYGQQTDQSWSR